MENVLLFTVLTSICTASKFYKAPSSSRVLDCYVVAIKGNTEWEVFEDFLANITDRHSDQSLPNFSALIFGVTKESFYGFAANLSTRALHYVMKNPIVAYVEEDAHHSLGQTSGSTSSIEQNWALDSIDGNRDYIFHRPCNLTGIGVDVYIVDTGLQYNHTEFSGRAEFSGCDSVDMMSSSQLQGSDCDGHGTAVAGIVGGLTTGVANKVTLRSVRAIKCNQNTTNALLILAFDCLLNQTKTRGRPAIAQVSVYGVKSRSVKRSIDTLSNHGITVVTLSGNRDSSSKRKMNSCKVAPASYIGVISVAGLKDNYHAFEKNYMGQCVDIFAPGYKVHVPYLYNKLNCGYSTACYARASGGSFAAPFVSGALALLLEKCPNLPQWRIKYTLINKMAVPHRITMPSTHIPKKYRKLTPNLTLHLGNEMCTIICSPPW